MRIGKAENEDAEIKNRKQNRQQNAQTHNFKLFIAELSSLPEHPYFTAIRASIPYTYTHVNTLTHLPSQAEHFFGNFH